MKKLATLNELKKIDLKKKFLQAINGNQDVFLIWR